MISILTAAVSDLPIIRDLANRIWPVAYKGKGILSDEQLRYMLDTIFSIPTLTTQAMNGHTFILASDNNNYTGFASWSLLKDEPVTYKLNKLYILPDKQGKGLGKILLDHVINDIKGKNAKALLLNVNRQNKALHFYKKLGFEIIGEEDIDIGHGYFMNDFVMNLPIT